MPLKLLISELRPELLVIWAEVFDGVKEVVLLTVNVQTLMALPEVDALLMMGMFAHERYGGRPIHKESQILSTQGNQGVPLWVVTTAPLSAHLEERRQLNGTARANIVQAEKLTPEEETYIVFTKVFKCIERFNENSERAKIRALGFDLKFLNFPWGEPRKEAEEVRRAYLEQYSKI